MFIFLGFILCQHFTLRYIFSFLKDKKKRFSIKLFLQKMEQVWLPWYALPSHSLDECWEGQRQEIKYYSMEQRVWEGLPRNCMILFIISHGLQRVNHKIFFPPSKHMFIVQMKAQMKLLYMSIYLHHSLLGFGALSWWFDSTCSKEDIIFEFSLTIKDQLLLFPKE